MIVFLDMGSQIISVYTEQGRTDVPFEQAGALKKIITGQALYVTNAIEVDSQSVIDLVSGIVGHEVGNNVGVVSKSAAMVKPSTSPTHIHFDSPKKLIIDEELVFEGECDIKPLDAEMLAKIESTPLMQNLLKSGKLKVIGNAKLKQLNKVDQRNKKLQLDRYSRKDRALDAIIVQSSISGAAEAAAAGAAMFDDTDDMELTAADLDGDMADISENEKILKELGIN